MVSQTAVTGYYGSVTGEWSMWVYFGIRPSFLVGTSGRLGVIDNTPLTESVKEQQIVRLVEK